MANQAMEKAFKEEFVLSLIEAIRTGGMEVTRINDYGTLAIPVTIGGEEGEDRYMTLKVVLAKAYDEEKCTGFDIFEGERAYEERLEADAAAEKARAVKKENALKDKAKRQAERDAKKKAEANKAK